MPNYWGNIAMSLTPKLICKHCQRSFGSSTRPIPDEEGLVTDDKQFGNHPVASEVPAEPENDEPVDIEQADAEYVARLIDAAEWRG